MLPALARVAGLGSALALVVGDLGSRHGGEGEVEEAEDAWADAQRRPAIGCQAILLGLAEETAAARVLRCRPLRDPGAHWRRDGRGPASLSAIGSGDGEDLAERMMHETRRQQVR